MINIYRNNILSIAMTDYFSFHYRIVEDAPWRFLEYHRQHGTRIDDKPVSGVSALAVLACATDINDLWTYNDKPRMRAT